MEEKDLKKKSLSKRTIFFICSAIVIIILLIVLFFSGDKPINENQDIVYDKPIVEETVETEEKHNVLVDTIVTQVEDENESEKFNEENNHIDLRKKPNFNYYSVEIPDDEFLNNHLHGFIKFKSSNAETVIDEENLESYSELNGVSVKMKYYPKSSGGVEHLKKIEEKEKEILAKNCDPVTTKCKTMTYDKLTEDYISGIALNLWETDTSELEREIYYIEDLNPKDENSYFVEIQIKVDYNVGGKEELNVIQKELSQYLNFVPGVIMPRN